jgi:cytochrome c oxidase subunit IV
MPRPTMTIPAMPGQTISQRRAELAGARLGVWVIVLLALLTGFEYLIAVSVTTPALVVVLLVPFALTKAVLIVTYFMHVAKAWRGEGAHA